MWVQRGERANLIGCPRHEVCSQPQAMSSEVKESPRVTKEQGVWVVQFGKQQEYRCATEAQARQLVTALLAQPA